jgi:hypothetical protein
VSIQQALLLRWFAARVRARQGRSLRSSKSKATMTSSSDKLLPLGRGTSRPRHDLPLAIGQWLHDSLRRPKATSDGQLFRTDVETTSLSCAPADPKMSRVPRQRAEPQKNERIVSYLVSFNGVDKLYRVQSSRFSTDVTLRGWPSNLID